MNIRLSIDWLFPSPHAILFQLMKRLLLFALLFNLMLAACKSGEKGDPGPAGPAGPTGATGPAGATGNANVIQITYGSKTHTGAELAYDLTGITEEQVRNSAFFTYVRTTSDWWHSLPGRVLNLSGTGYREYTTTINIRVLRLYITRASGTGTDVFQNARIVMIPANDLRNGRKAAVDFSNYEAVKQFYNLPD